MNGWRAGRRPVWSSSWWDWCCSEPVRKRQDGKGGRDGQREPGGSGAHAGACLPGRRRTVLGASRRRGGRADRGGGHRHGGFRADRAAHRGHRSGGPDAAARIRRFPRPRLGCRAGADPLRPVWGAQPRRLPGGGAPLRPAPPGRRVEHRRRLVAGRVPCKQDLDWAVPDRPVFRANRDHHAAWVNSRALSLAGVGADTSDPADGRIERDARGEPSGVLQEGAMNLVERAVPRPDLGEQVAGNREGQRYLHALRVTGWQEAIVGDYAVVPDCVDDYLEDERRGLTPDTVIGG